VSTFTGKLATSGGKVSTPADTQATEAGKGRRSADTGQKVTWERAVNSKKQLVPTEFDGDTKLPVPPGTRSLVEPRSAHHMMRSMSGVPAR
jgi:hypothetical protein